MVSPGTKSSSEASGGPSSLRAKTGCTTASGLSAAMAGHPHTRTKTAASGFTTAYSTTLLQPRSRIAQQRLESEIHVLLDMTVKQCRPRLVGGKVHAGAPVSGHHHRVLDNARSGFAINLGDLQLVAMHM